MSRKNGRYHRVLEDYLSALLNTGLYGCTRADVIERLVCDSVKRELERKLIPQQYTGVGYETVKQP